MQYFVEPVGDEPYQLQAQLDKIYQLKGKLVQVIWREKDNTYVVIHAIEPPPPPE